LAAAARFAGLAQPFAAAGSWSIASADACRSRDPEESGADHSDQPTAAAGEDEGEEDQPEAAEGADKEPKEKAQTTSK
jgi:hypothetical protein